MCLVFRRERRKTTPFRGQISGWRLSTLESAGHHRSGFVGELTEDGLLSILHVFLGGTDGELICNCEAVEEGT